MRARTVAAGIAVALVVMAVVTGLVMLGSPSEQRARRLDERRLRALQTIQVAIDEHWRSHGRRPESIAELMREPRAVSETKDPVTGREYGYRAIAERSYQLCAGFERSDTAERDAPFAVPFWAHPAGPHCFDLEARSR